MPWQRLTTLALALVPNNKGGVNSSQGHRGTAELLRRALFCTGALFVAWLALFAYHPLFWVVPIAFVLAFVREEVASSKLKRGVDIAVTVLCMLVIAVWIVRLINPVDAGLLFGGHAPAGVPDDIIHLEPPRWLCHLGAGLKW